jgi:heme/copper-type cytochrome/quinol oxidase subunit 4
MLLALAATLMAYQAPASGALAVGWFGDRLFLRADAGAALVESSSFYSDELTPGAPGNRSRWTRRQALLSLPGLGQETLSVTLVLQGWPAMLPSAELSQPELRVLAEDRLLARFRPDGQWREYGVLVPAELRAGPDLRLRLETSHTFTDSLGPDGRLVEDPRPKGVRLAAVRVASHESGLLRLLAPAWPVAGQAVLTAALLFLALRRLMRRAALAFVLAVLLTASLALALALARVWSAALLPWCLSAAAALLALAYARDLLRYYRALLARFGRGDALGYGLLAAGLAWFGLTLATWAVRSRVFDPALFRREFPDSLLYIIVGGALLALVLVQGRQGIPQVLAELMRRLRSGRLALYLLVALGGIWIGYQALLLRDLPAIGHADYADNGVVARNLLYGRGWVVDYISQYYRLYNGGLSTTRPQETWPLLQPLWIYPFFSAFGPSAWAARLPNLVFNALLLLLIYNIGTRLWDRRVGLCAALVTLTNVLFFNQTIYATSDLAFVVFATAAVYAIYRVGSPQPRGGGRRQAWAIGAGLLSGLMLLQRPSSGVIAAGMGLWLLGALWHGARGASTTRGAMLRRFLQALPLGIIWGSLALLLLTPYLARNLRVFGKPFYTTESHDAWVLEFSPDWDDIYSIYVMEEPLNGPGIPDRSWILRWGFDTTLRKIERQWMYTRNLLLPSWENSSIRLATRAEHDSITLLHTMGGWLALVGVLVALGLRRRTRLLSLLLMAFGPYVLFLVFYWHMETRYLPVLIPWLALIGMGLVWSAYDRLARLHGGRWSGLAVAIAIGMVVAVVRPSWPAIAEDVRDLPIKWAPDLEAYQWLRTLPPETVVMSRGPWQLNFYSERPVIMIPNTADVDRLLSIASYYRARYLVVETIQNTGAEGQVALQQLTLDRAAGEECRPTAEHEARPERRLAIAYCSRFYELADGRRYQTVVYRFPEATGQNQAPSAKN